MPQDLPNKIKVAIVGSRRFGNAMYGSLHLIDVLLSKMSKDTHEIVSGGAMGVDSYAEDAAKALGFDVTVFYPDWSTGKGAGLQRNSQIVAYADSVYAFYDGQSKGTLDTMKKAVAAGKLRRVFKESDDAENIIL